MFIPVPVIDPFPVEYESLPRAPYSPSCASVSHASSHSSGRLWFSLSFAGTYCKGWLRVGRHSRFVYTGHASITVLAKVVGRDKSGHNL